VDNFPDSGGHHLLQRGHKHLTDRPAAIDTNPAHDGNDDRAQELLHRLVLLQYNDGKWRRSHPVVQTLEGYKLAITPTTDPLGDLVANEAD
jgi:hypothetical protein